MSSLQQSAFNFWVKSAEAIKYLDVAKFYLPLLKYFEKSSQEWQQCDVHHQTVYRPELPCFGTTSHNKPDFDVGLSPVFGGYL